MATTYPGTIDSFTNPSGTSTLDSPDHSLQHSDANDAIEAIEAVIGTTAGTSVLKDFSAGEFAASLSGTQTFTNKTISTGSDIDSNVDVIEVLKKVYPVGSIYVSTASTNPNTLFGFGTWSAFGAGKVLVGIDSGDSDFDTSEDTGGAKTHTLSVDEMPLHDHSSGNFYGYSSSPATTVIGSGATNVTYTSKTTTGAGGGEAHNNLQPYIVTYMWKRTA